MRVKCRLRVGAELSYHSTVFDFITSILSNATQACELGIFSNCYKAHVTRVPTLSTMLSKIRAFHDDHMTEVSPPSLFCRNSLLINWKRFLQRPRFLGRYVLQLIKSDNIAFCFLSRQLCVSVKYNAPGRSG